MSNHQMETIPKLTIPKCIYCGRELESGKCLCGRRQPRHRKTQPEADHNEMQPEANHKVEVGYKIIEKFIWAGRWHVRLSPPFKDKEVWRNAHYIWLLGNPAFQNIPKNYVIHHLDRDQLNDDISNLVLMHRYHHTAYHSKYTNIETKITIHGRDISQSVYQPTTKPRFFKATGRKYFTIYFQTKDEDTGKSNKVWVRNWKGKHIDTPEMAEAICAKIWNESITNLERKSSTSDVD